MYPTRPGQKCRIVGSWSTDDQGKVGPNHHKEVTTISLYPMLAVGSVPVWKVSGQDLVSSYGAVGNTVDCLLYWLEVIPETDPSMNQETNKELVHDY